MKCLKVVTDQNEVLARLNAALNIQREYLTSYERPCEPLAYETLRTLDDLYCRDLMEPDRFVDRTERLHRDLSSWGVNHALRRILPQSLSDARFRDFPSREETQAKANDFMFNCGVLAMSERLEGWLRDGVLTGEIHVYPKHSPITNVLVARNAKKSSFDEDIGRAGLRWASLETWKRDRELEKALEQRHKVIEPELLRRVNLIDGWRLTYSTTPEIDDYFQEWAVLYLRRIFSQDLIGAEDRIGGRPFSRYLDVLSAVSARSQKHIAYSAIMRARYPTAHIRNLLTTYCPRDLYIESLAGYLDAERDEIESILSSLVLSPDNLSSHTSGGDIAWVPVVRASLNMLILPIYGLDINPFLFLLTDLRARHEADWFKIANNRERRWIEELEKMFNSAQWRTHGRNLQLRQGGKVLTDIDFVLYSPGSNEVALFQLKWQHPVGMDNRGRRSSGKNLITDSNRWIASVTSWLEQNGVQELLRRLGFASANTPSVHLIVLGRYHVHLSGYDEHDNRAIWSDWAHFQRAVTEEGDLTCIAQLVNRVGFQIGRSRAAKSGESLAYPIGDLAVTVNPTSVPDVTADT